MLFVFCAAPEDVFETVLETVKDTYIEKVPSEKLIAGALSGLMRSLDPYSSYMPPEVYRSMASINKGEVKAIGLELIERAGEIVVLTPITGSSAQKAGIRTGDVITEINGEKLLPYTSSETVTLKIRKSPQVTLGIKRKKTFLNVTLKKKAVFLEPVKFRKYHNILYIKVIYFGPGVTQTIRNIISQESFRGIILDVRNNPGGQFEEGVLLADLFLRESLPIVSVKGRVKDFNKTYASSGPSIANGQPIVLLINGNTASSSEILAGALKDNGRATLIGRKTFGKGSVQRVLNLGELGGIKVTVARFYTPKGSVIHEKGITPDIEALDPKQTPANYTLDLNAIDPQFQKGVQFLKDKE